MKTIQFVVFFVLFSIRSYAGAYWTQCNPDGMGLVSLFSEDGEILFWDWSDAPVYEYGGSVIEAEVGSVVGDEIFSGDTVSHYGGYYTITAGIPIPASFAVGQATDDFSIIQFSVASSHVDIEEANGINSEFMQTFGYDLIVCNIIPNATDEINRIEYNEYENLVGNVLCVQIKIPDSYQGSTFWFYLDAQTYRSDGYLLQHGFTEDAYLVLGENEATATPTVTPTATQTPTNTETSTPTPTPTSTATFTFTPTKTPTVPPTPTGTFTSTFTPTATWTPTKTKTPTPTSTATFTFTPTKTKTPTATATSTFTLTPTSTSTPTPIPGILDIAVVDIESATSVQIPGWTNLSVVIRNIGTISCATSTILSVSNTSDEVVYGTWTILPGIPAPGDETTYQCYITTMGLSDGTKSLRAYFDLDDNDISNNELISTIEFLPEFTPTPTVIPTYTFTSTPTATDTPTVTPTPTFTPTVTNTQTFTSTPTFTMTPTVTPTIIPTIITEVDADDELNLWPGGARAGAIHGGIIGATHVFDLLPSVGGFTLDDIAYQFRRGDIITVNDATEAYRLSLVGTKHWEPIGASAALVGIMEASVENHENRINLLEITETPVPTVVITGSGNAGITTVVGGYNIDVPTNVPTSTSTPTPTLTTTFTPTNTFTMVPTVVLTGGGIAGITPVSGGYQVNVPNPTAIPTYAYTPPTAQPTYAYTPPTAIPTLVITGGGIAGITPVTGGYNVQVTNPTAASTPTPQPTYAYTAPTAANTPTPQPTTVLTGGGIAGITPVSGGYNIQVQNPTAASTPTPQPTYVYTAPTAVPTVVITGGGSITVTPVSGGYNLNSPVFSSTLLDNVFSTTGLLKRTGTATYTTITDNSSTWDKALQWDGGSTSLVSATGRTSLGLGSAAVLASENPVANDGNLPTGAAVIAYATNIISSLVGNYLKLNTSNNNELTGTIGNKLTNSSFDQSTSRIANAQTSYATGAANALLLNASTSFIGGGSGSGYELTVNGDTYIGGGSGSGYELTVNGDTYALTSTIGTSTIIGDLLFYDASTTHPNHYIYTGGATEALFLRTSGVGKIYLQHNTGTGNVDFFNGKTYVDNTGSITSSATITASTFTGNCFKLTPITVATKVTLLSMLPGDGWFVDWQPNGTEITSVNLQFAYVTDESRMYAVITDANGTKHTSKMYTQSEWQSGKGWHCLGTYIYGGEAWLMRGYERQL